MRSTHRLVLGLFAFCGATLLVAPTLGQNEKTEEKPAVPAPAAPAPAAPAASSPAPQIGQFTITARDAKRERFDVAARQAPIEPFLKELAKQAGKNVILSDEVRASQTTVTFTASNQTPRNVLDTLALLGHFAWGSVGGDGLWLIVPRSNRVLTTLPPPVLVWPTPRAQKPEPGTPFEFNGETYYFVPLTKER